MSLADRYDDTKSEAMLRGVRIPSCPAVLTELMAELRQPLTNGKRIAALITRDVGLAAAVVKSANSPYFGSSRRIGSIADAIRVLGFGTLSNLVTETLLEQSLALRDASLERFWDNSRLCAALCAKIAGMLKGTRPETAYTVGLFHDCGIPLLVQRFPEYKQVLAVANTATGRWFTTVEDDALQTNHAVIGFFLARSWGLPESVCDAVLSHHDYSVFDRHSGLDDEACALVGINLIAEHVAGIHLRLKQDAEWNKGRDAVGGFFGVSPAELDDLVDDLLYQIELDQKQAAGA